MRNVAVILLVAALLGCTTTGSGSHEVRVTREAADVEHCKHIGAVQSVGPYALPGDDLEQIRSRTLAIGADTVLLNTSRRASVSGIAYRCRAS
jgi:outer membrane lipoprotein SlyB